MRRSDSFESWGTAASEKYDVSDLARFPDVLTVEKQEEDLDAMKERLLSALDLAIADFNSMREKEGAAAHRRYSGQGGRH